MPLSEPVPRDSVWCVVPVYNNRETVRRVVAECLEIIPRVVVVDDGSTDADLADLLDGLEVTLLRHPENRGKGAAILTASRHVEAAGGSYLITVDADGQHLPADMEKFLPLLSADEPALVIGCRDFSVANVPKSSRFGRSFANFWLLVETGVMVSDCQSGFRAYPVAQLNRLEFKGSRYDFEAEVLAKASWAGLELRTVEIGVYYPKPEERVSSFRPFLDNLRLTRIHSMLVGRRLLPLPHKRLVPKRKRIDLELLKHPGKLLRMLLAENATPEGLALAAGVGMFLAVLPLPGLHTVAILYAAIRFRLNKLMALNIQHLAMPPFGPALCIEIGHYLRHGRWLTEFTAETLFRQISARLYEWLLGSLLVAPVAAVLAGAGIYLAALAIRKVRCIRVSKEGC